MWVIGRLVLTFALVSLLTAPAWAQGRGSDGGFVPGGESMLSDKELQRELKVSDEQASKLNALVDEMKAKSREHRQKNRELPEDQRDSEQQEFNRTLSASVHKTLAEILKPDQRKRFTQIRIQQAGAGAFVFPLVQEALQLTNEQKTKLQAIHEETRQASNRIIIDSVGRDQADKREAMKKVSDLREQAFEQAYAQLTESQKTRWNELTGKPFKLEPPNR